LGAAVDAIRQAEQQAGIPAESGPTSKARRSVSNPRSATSLLLIIAAIVTVYIVLGVLYESFIHPVRSYHTSFRGVGALLSLMFTGHDLDIISIIGIILLIGIVKKNAIMMIDLPSPPRERRENLPGSHLSGSASPLPADPDDDLRGNFSPRCR